MSQLAEEIAHEINACVLRDDDHRQEIAAIIDQYLNDPYKSLWAVITNINHNRKIKRKVPLWSAVADFCGLGGTSASKLCIRLGFDPDLITGKENPPK